MLPEAEVAFLDEVFLGSTAILNTLLGVLNERTFRRGHTEIEVPLRVCVGASNGLPEDETLAAFADRFLARMFVEPVADAQLEELLGAAGDLLPSPRRSPTYCGARSTGSRWLPERRPDRCTPQRGTATRRLRGAGIALTTVELSVPSA